MRDKLDFLIIKPDATDRKGISCETENVTLQIWKDVKNNDSNYVNVIKIARNYFEGEFIQKNSFVRIDKKIFKDIEKYNLANEPDESYEVAELYIDNFQSEDSDNLFIKKTEIYIEQSDKRTFVQPRIVKSGEKYILESCCAKSIKIGFISDKRDFKYIENIDRDRDFIIVIQGKLKILKTKKLKRIEVDFNIIFNFNSDNKERDDKEKKKIEDYITNRLTFDEKVYLSLCQRNIGDLENYLVLIGNRYRKCRLQNNNLWIGYPSNRSGGGRNTEKKVCLFQIDSKKLKYRENDLSVVEEKLDEINIAEEINISYIETEFMKMMNKYLYFEKELLEESKSLTGRIKYIKIEGNRFILSCKNSETLKNWAECKGAFVAIVSKRESMTIGTIKEVTENYIAVTFDSDLTKSIIKKSGELEINYFPSEIMQKRRDRAMEVIKNSSGMNPELISILSGEKKEWKRVSNYEHLSEAEKFDINKGIGLNEKQIKAINGGLNTGEIFLIQGPPGTGKTSVIKKITGIAIKQEDNVLISSFQNLAVDNVINGLIDNDVIAYRHGVSEDSSMIDKAYNDIINRIEKSLDENTSITGEEILSDTKASLQTFKKAFITELDDEKMKCMIYDFKKEFEENSYVSNQLVDTYLENIIETVPTQSEEKVEFNISYPKFREFDADFLDEVSEVKRNILKQANTEKGIVLKEASNILEEIDDKYLDGDLDEDTYELEVEKVKELVNKYMESLEGSKTESKSKISEDNLFGFLTVIDGILDSTPEYIENENINIIKEFRDTIKSTPVLIEELLKKYADVKGTTCQKVSSKAFNDVNQGNSDYEYVIIDEAARANPLDLIIPLIRGKKVLLVGDHKQLPHMIDSAIDTKFKTSQDAKESYETYVKESLFGRLYHSLPNNRKIMLDTQYRMNEQIGSLVSELFYDNELKTGTKIVNDLDFYNGESLIVKDVLGAEKRNSVGSYYNEKEVEEIIKKLKELNEISNKREKKTEVGIITFYRGQVDEILKNLKKEKLENLDINVGTVDAYQGLEKEVVFLSTVRTHGIGFAANLNRVNVALSRAKKLLLIFSDVDNMKKDELYEKIFKRCKRGEEFCI